MVELHLAKVDVEGSNPFARSLLRKAATEGWPIFARITYSCTSAIAVSPPFERTASIASPAVLTNRHYTKMPPV